jgi:hypothetical protein
MRELIQQVASGLRNMKNKPNAFIYVGDNCFDLPHILDFPVFQSAFISNGMDDGAVDFIPIWNSEGEYSVDVKRFNDGYLEQGR